MFLARITNGIATMTIKMPAIGQVISAAGPATRAHAKGPSSQPEPMMPAVLDAKRAKVLIFLCWGMAYNFLYGGRPCYLTVIPIINNIEA